MALKVSNPTGFTSLLKEGYKHFEEAIYRNISACNDLTSVTKSSFGPHGLNKMIVNNLEKLFVTSDAATIMKELEVVHPAAKLLVMASQQQEIESGDATNFVLIFAGELLKKAEDLLKMGMHPSEIIEGYERAFSKAIDHLESLIVKTVAAFTEETLLAPVQSALATKQYGYETFLAKLIVKAALTVMPRNPKAFNVDSVRVVKIMGGSLLDSQMIPGMVFGRQPESIVQRAAKAKIAVYSCPVDVGRTETKGTVLIHDAKELLDFSKGEESLLQDQIQQIVDTGVKVVVTGGTFGDLALHFLNRHGLVAIKIPSKFDLQRLCRVVGASASARLGPLRPEEMGYCDLVDCVEIGGDRVTLFRQQEESTGTKTASIVVRGSTLNFLDDVERAIDDGVNVVKSLTKDGRLLPGAGATEINIANELNKLAEVTSGLPQYGIQKFAEAMEVVPRALSENSGLDTDPMIAKLYAAHQGGNRVAGIDIENLEGEILPDVIQAQIFDVYSAKKSALHLATDAALSVLRVDSIIMSKPAGGPKPRQSGPMDDD